MAEKNPSLRMDSYIIFVYTGDLDAVGKCMDLYWRLKKVMAPGCETESVSKLIKAFRPHASGMCMAGAGGGGFMYVLAKDTASKKLIEDLVEKMDVSTDLYKHYMGLVATKPVFGVSDKVSFKPVSSARETS